MILYFLISCHIKGLAFLFITKLLYIFYNK